MNTSRYVSLECFQPDILQEILARHNYQNIDEFNKYNPNFTIQIDIPMNTSSNIRRSIHQKFLRNIQKKKIQKKKEKKVLDGFTFMNYKKCLLVKHHDGLDNPNDVSKEFVRDGFSRPMWWNPTLEGWVASTKDEDLLIGLGAYKYTNNDL